ncbi:transcriptional regulator PpsR [Jannaschia aquimarina]|uniref:Bacterial regulatory protein, Fis family n=1 Tax=Jannaschia aquimarina TaxID=935700 RepID=A0A0D1CJL4_9RHOB|nr:transcriptional regulator PpsR [Jannaschia aquimarina]KIT14892.1 Bacterial regulatory protein, Fis family [Jannaschia aquimarina]SNS58597.1 transcriptional regulator PpsR [Jannaschia aquimarina]
MATREKDFWNERAVPRIAPEHLSHILATAADLALIVGESGTIHDVVANPLNSSFGKVDHWVGRNIGDFLALDSREKVLRRLQDLDPAVPTPPMEVNHVDGANWTAPMRYTLHPTGQDGRILLLGRDLRPLADLQQRLVRTQAALERDFEAQRVHETRFRVLLAEMSEGTVLIDATTGRVQEANDRAASLLGTSLDALRGAAFTAEFDGRRRSEFLDELARAGAAGTSVEVRTARGGAMLRLLPHAFRAGGDRAILCRIATDESHRPATSPQMAEFFDHAPDAIALIDTEGRVTRANDAFLSLVDMDNPGDLRGRSLIDFLGRGGIDLKMLTGEDRPRLHATRLISAYGTPVPVEIAPVDLADGGTGFVIRETAIAQPLRDEAGPEQAPDRAAQNARALVGAAPLRDIISSMTDVVEKECIEAAIELTDNNRVAAADMLGLSRQSLYVKLRKFGLLQRDES